MKHTRFFILLGLFLGFSLSVFGQQDAQFSQYMFRGLYFNPAVAGLDTDNFVLGVSHRSQWLGYDPTFDDGGAPSSQVFELSAPIGSANSGLGLILALDRTGPLQSSQIKLSYAYHLDIGNYGHRLSFGVRGGLYNQVIDASQYRPRDGGDPVLQPIIEQGKVNQWQPDLGAGVYFSHPKYYVGLGFDHLLGTTFDYGIDINVSSLEPHSYLMAGGNLEAGTAWAFAPTALVKTDFNTFSFDTNLMITYMSTYFVGGGARVSSETDAAVAMIGMHILESKNLTMSYSIDLVTSGSEVKAPTSHEISLGYRIPVPAAVTPPIIRTPRFRF